jgi:hypothetical protein
VDRNAAEASSIFSRNAYVETCFEGGIAHPRAEKPYLSGTIPLGTVSVFFIAARKT